MVATQRLSNDPALIRLFFVGKYKDVLEADLWTDTRIFVLMIFIIIYITSRYASPYEVRFEMF